jgi:uncharacterized membrane protein YgcG
MNIYNAAGQSGEETLRTRRLLKDWAGEGLITGEQYQQLEQQTVSDLRTTNIYLRLVLFLFTLIGVAAAIGLFFFVFLSRPSQPTVGVACLIFAALSYAAAEIAVHRERLYRYGIEEALLVWSVGLLCWGVEAALFSGHPYSPRPNVAECLVPAVGALFSVWIWLRFGLWYFFLGAMGFMLFLPGHWTASVATQRAIVAGLYGVGLLIITATRPRRDLGLLRDTHSLAEAFLWLGIYLAINLKVSAVALPWFFWLARTDSGPELARPFYWFTWVLIWCLPPLILTLGVRRREGPARFVIAAGAIAAVLTFVSNKPYLGWQRHTWDPMLLGIVLAGVALYLRRWLAAGPDGVRHGFTAERLSARDQRWLSSSSAALGLLSPQSIAPPPQNSTPDVQFGGGASGGAGASGDF